MTLTRPEFFQLAGLVVLLILISGVRQVRRRRSLAAFLGGPRAARRLANRDLYASRAVRVLVLAISALALGAAAADPRPPEPPPPPPPVPPRTLLIAIDVSASMQAADASPNRLGLAVAAAHRIVDTASSDRIGLLLFAGESYLLSPPTADHGVVRFLLDGVTPRIASAHDPGTRLSVPLREAVRLLDPAAGANGERALVLIGDGEAGEPERSWRSALDAVTTQGIRVHAIATGTEGGRGISLPRGQYQLGGPVTRADGSAALSRAAPRVLRRISELGGGGFALASEPRQMEELLNGLRLPPPPLPLLTDGSASLRSDPVVLLLLLALALLVFESLMDARLPRFAPLLRRSEV